MTTYTEKIEAFESRILTKVAEVIEGFGTTVDFWIHKSTTVNRYNQSTRDFEDEAITCKARAVILTSKWFTEITQPQIERISVLGNLQDADLVVIISRSEMIAKFPHKDEGRWLDEKDEFTYQNYRYKILLTHPSGRIKNYDSLYVVVGKSKEGEFRQ